MAKSIDSKVLFITTSPRTPEKMIPEINLLSKNFENEKWNTETQIAFMELLRKGKITEDEMHEHPRKNEITRAVGIKKALEVDTGTIRLKNNTLILLCTDGLTGMVDDTHIAKILSEYRNFTKEDLMNCGEHLFNAAYNAGAADNVSLILIDYWGRKGGEG